MLAVAGNLSLQSARGASQFAYSDVIKAHGGSLAEDKSSSGRAQRVWLGQAVDLSEVHTACAMSLDTKPQTRLRIKHVASAALS